MPESGGSGRRSGRRWCPNLSMPNCGAVLPFCSRCGYPERNLCCFGCSEHTRIIFIGSGSTVLGCSEIFLPACVLISFGILSFPLFLLLFMGLLHIGSGLSLIYSVEKDRIQLTRWWTPVNWVLLVLSIFWMIYTVIAFQGMGPSFVLTVIFGAIIMLVTQCYCIAVVTHYRLRVMEGKTQSPNGDANPNSPTARQQGLVF